MRLIASGQLNPAQNNLEAARGKDPTYSDPPDFERALRSRVEKARSEDRKYDQDAASFSLPQDQARLDNAYTSIQQIWSENPEFRGNHIAPPRRGECRTDLAGYGRRRGGECWDLMGRAKGPLMVVIPASGAIGAPFAISKYEISASDFNDYCKATGRRRSLPRSKARLPLTTISADEAEAFVRWLSQDASKTEKRKVVYRPPTEQAWEHAARAAGGQPAKKFNCRLTPDGSVISGHALVDAAFEWQNGLGLSNYVGNAQEWVRAAGGLKARGGNYQEALSRCDASISRRHDGQPDGVTGFCRGREMG